MKKWILGVGLCLGFIGIVSLIFLVFWIYKDNDLCNWWNKINIGNDSNIGQFLVGLVGIFISGAGFLLIYSTFQEQKIFNTTTSKLSDKQQFETTFFNLITTYRSIVNSTKGEIKLINPTKSANKELKEGVEYFTSVLHLTKNQYKAPFLFSIKDNMFIPEIEEHEGLHPNERTHKLQILIDDGKSDSFSKQYNIALYEYTYKDYQNRLGHYFRFIYNIIKFCIEERYDNGDAKRYIDILQAQISNDELGLLYYNALSKNGNTGDGIQRFYNWLDYFDFFENIDVDSLIFRKHHIYYSTLFKFLTKKEKEEKKEHQHKHKLIIP